ncbi:hypothetical protein D9M68_559550 [compost metagenome]
MLHTQPADTLFTAHQLKISGQVKQKKPIKSPLSIGILGGNLLQLFETDQHGYIAFNTEDLRIEPDKKMYLFVNGGQNLQEVPKIFITDEFEKVNQRLARLKPENETLVPSELANNTMLILPGNEKVVRLKEVVITKTNSELHGWGSGANACGDYVCLYNILNCRNHINDVNNRQPIKGQSYLVNGFPQIYSGCKPVDNNIFTEVKGLHVPKQFYVDDYKDPNEPALFSTLYWNYSTLLQRGHPAEIRFYTGDITGKFNVTVQGIGTKDVVYGSYAIEVKE